MQRGATIRAGGQEANPLGVCAGRLYEGCLRLVLSLVWPITRIALVDGRPNIFFATIDGYRMYMWKV